VAQEKEPRKTPYKEIRKKWEKKTKFVNEKSLNPVFISSEEKKRKHPKGINSFTPKRGTHVVSDSSGFLGPIRRIEKQISQVTSKRSKKICI